ncbi:MAG: hypothetical protein IK061_00655 [Desulfovibrio sp.]|nr:hypothetical protein [Desulfovibrio sp.]
MYRTLDSDIMQRVNACFLGRMRASQAEAQAASESGAALKEHMAEAFRSGAMKNVASLFLGAARTLCVEAQVQPGPANDAHDANVANDAHGAKVTEDRMTHGHEGMQHASTLILDYPRVACCETLAKPKPAEDTEGALTANTDSTSKEKSHASFPDGPRAACPETMAEHAPAEGMEDTMAVDKASSDLEHSSSSLPYGPRAMRLAALSAPESTAGTVDVAAVDNVSGGKEPSKAGVAGWAEAARPEGQALPAASAPVKGLEASGKARKVASGKAGQASAARSEADAKLGPDGTVCQRDLASWADSGGQACPAAALPLSEDSRRDAGEAQESKQDRPSGEKTPEAKVTPAGGSIPDGSSQKHWDAVPSLGVMGVCEPVPSGIAVIWTRSRDNEHFVLFRTSRAELEGIIRDGDSFAAFVQSRWRSVRALVGSKRANLLLGAYVSRRQRRWADAASYLAEFTPQKAVRPVMEDIFAEGVLGKLSCGYVVDGDKGGSWSLFLQVARPEKAPLVSKEISVALLKKVCAEITKRDGVGVADAEAGGASGQPRCAPAE